MLLVIEYIWLCFELESYWEVLKENLETTGDCGALLLWRKVRFVVSHRTNWAVISFMVSQKHDLNLEKLPYWDCTPQQRKHRWNDDRDPLKCWKPFFYNNNKLFCRNVPLNSAMSLKLKGYYAELCVQCIQLNGTLGYHCLIVTHGMKDRCLQ